MACRKRDVEFTAVNFCKLIHGSLFTSELVRKAVYLDNLTDYKLYFGEDSFAFENALDDAINVPHFPQISLNIFKLAPYDYKQHHRLMKNVCLFPHVFKDFFRHLALLKSTMLHVMYKFIGLEQQRIKDQKILVIFKTGLKPLFFA